MEIHIWDESNGCWNLHKKVEWPCHLGPKRFLFWEWIGKTYVPVRDYCIAAVNEAKAMRAERHNGVSVRVYWDQRGDTVWQDGVWQIDTNRYDFQPDSY